MDQKELHEKASTILATVMDLPYEKALRKIDEQCGDTPELKQAVIDLFNEIYEEEQEQINKTAEAHNQTTQRIGQQPSELTSKIISDWTKILFGNKRNRLILIITFLVLLLGTGIVAGIYIRDSLLQSEREEKIALLNTNKEIMDRWIFYEKAKINAVASNPELVGYAIAIDSLESLDESYELLRNSQVARNATQWLVNAAGWGEYSGLSILSNSSPKDLLASANVDSTGLSPMFNSDLGAKIYNDYVRSREGEIVFVPPMNDYDLLINPGNPSYSWVWCNFMCPIRDEENDVKAILVGTYHAADEFSQILQLSQHGSTSETYAFNTDGMMLSSSRFTADLRKTYLLNYDPSAETLYRFELKDPGFNIMDGRETNVPRAEMPYTKIVQSAINHLKMEDSVYLGAVMTPYRDYRGVDVIGAYMWLPEYNFGLITEEDFDESLASLVYFRYTFGIFYAAILVLSFLLYNSNVRIARIGKKVDDFSLLGQYKLREKLGEGGFGEVYKAEHTFLKTPVAIKILKSEFAHTDMLDRFEKEVKITSSLTHPNTIKVYDYGTTENNNFYYVMEFLNGISLDKVVQTDDEMSVARGIHIMYHVCLSLKEAHEKGLVHRDIKPMNIMLCNQGGAYDVVKVLDFGLVKDLDTSISQQTQINRIGGTPMFMAPERLRDPFNADQRVDIYAVGAVGLFMFSGQYLLELVSQKMLSGQETLQGDFRKHLIERKDIPTDLRNLLAECVHFDPQKRPSSIDVLVDYFEEKNRMQPWTRKDAMNWWKQYDVYS